MVPKCSYIKNCSELRESCDLVQVATITLPSITNV